MKINPTKGIPLPKGKLLKIIMRTFLFLCLTSVFSFAPNNTFSQNAKIEIDADKTISVAEIFDLIQEQAGYKFVYSDNLINNAPKVRLKKGTILAKELIKEGLSPIGCTFEFTENETVIVKKDRSFSIEKSTDDQKIQFAITGNVQDENGEPLPGANILEKGTTNGTQTDFDGNFSLEVADENAILVISYIGFATQEIAVNGQTDLSIALAEDAAGLDEVVIVGYGTQKKSDLTGSVISVSEKDLQSRPVASFQDAIQGRASGVNIRQNGGDLEGDYAISIRGVGSVTGSNSPLIVVDGVPLFSGNLSTINPKDIASVNILKDASSTAIYGARASNGVVIITTRTGSEGKAKFTFSAETGFEQIAKRYDVMNTEEQRILFLQQATNEGQSTAIYDDPSLPVWQIDNDWQELGTRTAFRRSFNLGVNGGTDKSKYAVSASVLDREGTILNTDLKSWNLRANIDSKIGHKLKIITNIAGSHQKSNFINPGSFFGGGGYRELLKNHTYTPAFDEDGNLDAIGTTATPYFGFIDNPLVNLLLETRERNVTRILGRIKLDYDITKGLLLSGNVGGDVVNTSSYYFRPVYAIGFGKPTGSVDTSSGEQINWVSELTLQYEKELGDHNLKMLVGVSAQQFQSRSVNTNGSGTVNNDLDQLSNQSTFSAQSSDVSSGLSSTFLRGNYAYKNKYLLTATVRRDGSSRFGPGNRFGTFPSGSLAWKLSEEDFLKDNNVINNLKLRASYGLTGNQNIGDFAFNTNTRSTGYSFGGLAVLGNSPLNLGNPNLQWESSKQLDIGLNVGLFAGRLNFEIDYYDKRSEDLLLAPPIAMSTGVEERPIVNLGSIKNSGLEFSFNSKNLTGKVKWSTDFNITYNKNEVLDIGLNSIGEPNELAGNNAGFNANVNLTKTGLPIASFWMYEFGGIWQLGEEAEATAWNNAVPGDPKYVDKNNNGVFDSGDQDFTGTNPHPKFFGGINNTVSYKNFSFSIFTTYATGYQLYHSGRQLMAIGAPFIQNLAEMTDAWTPQNPSNTSPRANQTSTTTGLVIQNSTRFLEDAGFFKIKNINLSYNLPKNVVDKMGIESARFILSGTNLHTFTKYSGLDPEANSKGDLLSAGIDDTPYPLTKTYSLSLELGF